MWECRYLRILEGKGENGLIWLHKRLWWNFWRSQSHKDDVKLLETRHKARSHTVIQPQQPWKLHPQRLPGPSSSILSERQANTDRAKDKSYWFKLSNDLIFEVLRDKRGGGGVGNTDSTKCNFMTPPVTSSCFVNLAPTLLPWGLSMKSWHVAAPASFASTAGACNSPLHSSSNTQLVQKPLHRGAQVTAISNW